MGAIARFRPFAALDAHMDDMVRRALTDPPSAVTPQDGWLPAADVYQDGSDALILMNLPSINPENVSVQTRNRMVVVSGERETVGAPEGATVLRQEIRRGRFRRGFRLPDGTDVEAISATYRDGVLEVRLPGARRDATTRDIPVEVTVQHADTSSTNTLDDGAPVE